MEPRRAHRRRPLVEVARSPRPDRCAGKPAAEGCRVHRRGTDRGSAARPAPCHGDRGGVLRRQPVAAPGLSPRDGEGSRRRRCRLWRCGRSECRTRHRLARHHRGGRRLGARHRRRGRSRSDRAHRRTGCVRRGRCRLPLDRPQQRTAGPRARHPPRRDGLACGERAPIHTRCGGDRRRSDAPPGTGAVGRRRDHGGHRVLPRRPRCP